MIGRVDTLHLPHAAADAVAAAAYAHEPNETGGIMLGTIEGKIATVAALIGPGPDAEHRPTSFDPDQAWQLEALGDVWQSAAADWRYLGDWHSHPGAGVRPSVRDWKVARLIASSPDARCPAPLMLIAAVGESVRLGAHQLRTAWFRRVEVRPVESSAILRL